jgi:hypothetical protein
VSRSRLTTPEEGQIKRHRRASATVDVPSFAGTKWRMCRSRSSGSFDRQSSPAIPDRSTDVGSKQHDLLFLVDVYTILVRRCPYMCLLKKFDYSCRRSSVFILQMTAADQPTYSTSLKLGSINRSTIERCYWYDYFPTVSGRAARNRCTVFGR